MTVRLGPGVAFAQIGIVGYDEQIRLEALRLFGLPEHAPALLCGMPTLPVGTREFQAETSLELPSLAPSATHLVDVSVLGCRQGDLAEAALASSTRFIFATRRAASWCELLVEVGTEGMEVGTDCRRKLVVRS